MAFVQTPQWELSLGVPTTTASFYRQPQWQKQQVISTTSGLNAVVPDRAEVRQSSVLQDLESDSFLEPKEPPAGWDRW